MVYVCIDWEQCVCVCVCVFVVYCGQSCFHMVVSIAFLFFFFAFFSFFFFSDFQVSRTAKRKGAHDLTLQSVGLRCAWAYYNVCGGVRHGLSIDSHVTVQVSGLDAGSRAGVDLDEIEVDVVARAHIEK